MQSIKWLIFQHRVQQDLWQRFGHGTAKNFLAQAKAALVQRGQGGNAFVILVHSG